MYTSFVCPPPSNLFYSFRFGHLNNTWSVSTDYKAHCYVVFSTPMLPHPPQAQVALPAHYS